MNKVRAYLSENGVAIVGEDNAAHRVEQHLEHGLGSEGGADNVGDSLSSKLLVKRVKTYSGSLDVGGLGLSALLTLGVLVQNEHWRS